MRSRLPLEEVLDSTPQQRYLVDLFEEDCVQLQHTTRQVLSAVGEFASAQRAASNAAALLAAALGTLSKQKFPLEDTSVDMPAVAGRLSHCVEDAASWMDCLAQQVETCVRIPMAKLHSELGDLNADGRGVYADAEATMDEAEERFLRVSRKESPKKYDDVNRDVYHAKLQYHKVALEYFSRLNAVQSARYTKLIEPALSLVYAFRSFFTAGHEALRQADLTEFLSKTQLQMQEIAQSEKEETTHSAEVLASLAAVQQSEASMYLGEQTGRVTAASERRGYLRCRNKHMFTSSWDRYFVWTQGAELCWQADHSLAGEMLLDLSTCDGARAEECVEADRRFVILLNEGGSSERRWQLQARNALDMLEWIATMNGLAGARSGRSSSASVEREGQETPVSPAREQRVDRDRELPQTQLLPLPIQFDLLSIGRLPSDFDEKEVEGGQMFEVGFLGSVEISQAEGESTDDAVLSALSSVLSARSEYGLDSPSPCRLLVCHLRLVLTDGEQRLRAFFDFCDIALWMVSRENERHFAMLTKAQGDDSDRPRLTCHVLETPSGARAADVCAALARATANAYQKACSLIQSGDPSSSREVVLEESTPVEQEETKYESFSEKTALERVESA